MSEYEAQAEKFLTKHGLTIKAAFVGDRCPTWCDGKHVHGDRYRVTVKRKEDRKSISFDFWNSWQDAHDGKAPTAYGVLTCMNSDYGTPETFEDFCSEYGYEQDSRKAEQTFKAADKFARKLRAFFTEEEAEALSEIR